MHTAFSTRAPTHAMFPLAARDMVSCIVKVRLKHGIWRARFLALHRVLEIVNAQNRSKAYQREHSQELPP